MLHYANLFWDFDGTLYNSYPQIVRAFEMALRDFDVPANACGNDLELLKTSVFHALEVYAEKCELPLEELHQAFTKYHHAEPFFPAYDGLRECLTRLKESGATHYLYTHRNARAWEHLEKDGLRELFADGVTEESGFPYKPAPDALLALMKRHALQPGDCAMIGDREIDVQSGQNASMAGILFDPEHFYPHIAADGRADSMEALYRLLTQ